jgi:cell division septal protein FtsQ
MRAKRNPNLGSSQVRTKKRRLFWVRFYIILFFVLVIVFGLAILSGNQKVIIKTFLVSGNNSVPTAQILNIADQDISGRYLGLFARSNFLFFPRFKIASDLLAQIKTLKEVEVNWSNWQTVSIKVLERRPHSVWCGQDPKAPDETCSFVDETGYLFSPAPTFSGNIFVKYYGTISQYSKIFSLIDLLDKKSLEVTTVYFDGLDYHFYLATGPEIIFNDKEGSFNSAFQNLFTALDSKNLDLINGADKINYVDLRFASKIVIGKISTSTVKTK